MDLNVLFLGAGKRLSLLERIAAACRSEGVTPHLFGYEDSRFVPIAQLATIIIGKRWNSPDFKPHLLNAITENRIQVIVPCMDGATVQLSAMAGDVTAMGCWPVASEANLCRILEDKQQAEQWFVCQGVKTPVGGLAASFPWMVKRRHGFGSRGQFKVENQELWAQLQGQLDMEEYLIQPFIEGPEYTVDAYVGRDGQILGCVTRRRLHVVDGEVVQSVTQREEKLIDQATRILKSGGFCGPITLQAIEQGGEFWFLEINPRFGGGVILSMEAGADYARLLVREALGRPVTAPSWREKVLMTRAYREVFHEEYEYDDHC